MRFVYFSLLFLSVSLAMGLPSVAQNSTQVAAELSLRADELVYNNDDATIIARGNVVLSYKGRRVRANQVVYNQSTRRVQAQGAVELISPDGDRLVADNLDLTDDFSDGFISSLQVETSDKTYFSATHAEQLEGATVFYNGIYTPCEPCADKPERPATWQVKAEKITLDSIEHTISYEDATLEIYGIPVVYIPRFSHGDPSMTRKSGFLVPDVQFSDDLGTSYHHSYFKTLGDSSDVKLSMVSYSNQGILGRVDWRRQFSTGLLNMTLTGIDQRAPEKFSRMPDNSELTRTMFGTKANFDLSQKWSTGWDLLFQSDDSFSNTYDLEGYSDITVTNEIYLQGLGERSSFYLAGYDYEVQGSSFQQEDEQALVHPVLDYYRIFSPQNLGGEVLFDMNITSLSRKQASDFNERLHGIEGRLSRISANVEWRRSFILSSFSFTPSLGVYGDGFSFSNDNRTGRLQQEQENEARFVPKAALEIAYPLLATANGSRHIIEPIAQIISRPNLKKRLLPNEDSQSLVFDASSLFQHNKFSGYDRIESGTRANYGLRYSGIFQNDIQLNALFGQSYHLGGDNPFALPDLTNTGAESGLRRAKSDYVASIAATLPSGDEGNVAVFMQGRFNEKDLSAERMESSLNFGTAQWNVANEYTFVNSQPMSGFADVREQFNISGELKFSGNWRIFGQTGYDLENDGFISDSYGIGYDDSCLSFSVVFSKVHELYSSSENERSLSFKFRLRSLADFQGAN